MKHTLALLLGAVLSLGALPATSKAVEVAVSTGPAVVVVHGGYHRHAHRVFYPAHYVWHHGHRVFYPAHTVWVHYY